MEICPDYEDLFKIFNKLKIKYLVVGGQAVIFYSEPRFTKDIDLWVSPDINDEKIIYKALSLFGAPLKNINPLDFKKKETILQIGVAPVRIDILMNISGIVAKRAWAKRRKSKYGNTSINIIGIDDLIKSKKSASRPQDLLDIASLMSVKKYWERKK